MNYFFFIIVGYLSGSVLYAYLLPRFLGHVDITACSDDHNPGAFNAFKYAGRGIGILVILLELAKGFFPVFVAAHFLNIHSLLFSLVLAAPVLGHAFPLFRFQKGGKAIAVSFGSLLGLFPILYPVLLLAVFYLFFSLLIVIQPHLLRSIVTFTLFSLISLFRFKNMALAVGSCLISGIVVLKHVLRYEKEPVSVHFLQQHH